MLKLENYSVAYGESSVIKALNLEIKDNEIVALLGRNGMGKTTLIHQIRDQLKEKGIPFVAFDNLKDGGHQSVSAASFYNDFEFMATALASSEGENIVLNLGKLNLKIKGDGLVLSSFSFGQTDITGDIVSLEFERIG